MVVVFKRLCGAVQLKVKDRRLLGRESRSGILSSLFRLPAAIAAERRRHTFNCSGASMAHQQDLRIMAAAAPMLRLFANMADSDMRG
jgi:hypothetical protein